MPAAFHVPSTIVIGAGAAGELPAQIRRLQARRALLVTDPFLAQSGLSDRVVEEMQREGITTFVFAGVQPDPTDRNVADGLRLLQESHAELIVAVGGGSSIDAAKAIAILATNPAPLSRYAGYYQIPRAGAPVIAVPTTAGTGSEVTKVAVITDTGRSVKMMMLDPHLLPAAALVDYELSMSMPPALTAHVGVDTLTHGMEAYVSRKANGMTDSIALSCISRVAEHLETAWKEPDNREAREGMALAACQGGMAFANSSVCLVHGMSRPLGALFHLPHGLSNAVLLPTVTRFSLAGAVQRYATVARLMGYASPGEPDEAAAHALADGLQALNQRLGIGHLRDCRGMDQGQFEQSLEKMAQDALASGSPQNNPVVPTAVQIIDLYGQAW